MNILTCKSYIKKIRNKSEKLAGNAFTYIPIYFPGFCHKTISPIALFLIISTEVYVKGIFCQQSVIQYLPTCAFKLSVVSFRDINKSIQTDVGRSNQLHRLDGILEKLL